MKNNTQYNNFTPNNNNNNNNNSRNYSNNNNSNNNHKNTPLNTGNTGNTKTNGHSKPQFGFYSNLMNSKTLDNLSSFIENTNNKPQLDGRLQRQQSMPAAAMGAHIFEYPLNNNLS